MGETKKNSKATSILKNNPWIVNTFSDKFF